MRTSILLIVLWGVPSALAADWPQWRGTNRDGTWPQTDLPDKFPDGGLKARWRQPIGGGYAGIAVVEGRVFTLDRRKEPKEVERILSLDAANGKELWSFDYPVTYGKLDYGNGPRSTPTVHDGRVYTLGALGHLHCLEAATGKMVWSVDTVKEFKGRVPTWGHACSPLVDGDRLIVQVGGQPDACLVALDRKTGKELWRSLADRPGYSSPVMIDAPGGQQLIYWTAQHVNGLDPATGKVRWQLAHTTDYDVTISDPVYLDGVLLVSDYWKGCKAIQLDDKGINPKVVWEGKRLSLLMATPLTKAGHFFALDRREGVKCLEAKTGQVKWEGEHVTPRDTNPQATLVWIGDRVLILNAPGELVLAKMSPEGYKEISKTSVIDFTWANPAFADKCLYVRNDKEIVCVPLVGR
jgi:outer membrane protein assembly factor BamB